MMKLAVTVLSLFLALNSSQASTAQENIKWGSPKRSASKTPTLTKSVRVLAAKKTQRRLLATNDLTDGDDGPPGTDELDMQSPYRRPEVSDAHVFDDDISEHALVRLAVSRARAMEVYRQKWC